MEKVKRIPFLLYRIVRKLFRLLYSSFTTIYTKILLTIFRVDYRKDLNSNGRPVIDISNSGKMKIGEKFKMNNGIHYNRIGRQQRCYLIVGENAMLEIGNNVGISSTAIICNIKILIADNVKIGGNTVIYDSDFHSLDFEKRLDPVLDRKYIKKEPVIIGKNVFIGSHSTILKGVEIGENSIIAACSVVTKNVGPNEIWGGNPARFIKRTDS